MDRNQVALLKKIMEYGFAALDLHLYLDTHPDDQKALRDFDYYNKQTQALNKQYEQYYGPLTVSDAKLEDCYWKWINEPWPWEIQY